MHLSQIFAITVLKLVHDPCSIMISTKTQRQFYNNSKIFLIGVRIWWAFFNTEDFSRGKICNKWKIIVF